MTPIGRDTIDLWDRHGLLVVLLALGAVFLVLFTRYVGWWRPVMREEPRTAPRWTMAVTALDLVAGLAATATFGVFRLGASEALTLGFYSVLCGFSYVILYQGLLLVAFRTSMPEVGVWFLTSLVRMAQGSLVPAMAVCVLWDFALRIGRFGDAPRRVFHGPNWFVEGLSPVEGLIFWLMLIVTFVAAWQIIRAKKAATPAKPLPLHVTAWT